MTVKIQSSGSKRFFVGSHCWSPQAGHGLDFENVAHALSFVHGAGLHGIQIVMNAGLQEFVLFPATPCADSPGFQ